MSSLAQDLRYALRMIRRSPAFSAIAILTLALGIGLTTAIFSVVHAVLLSPLPYDDAERLTLLWESEPGLPVMMVSYPDYLDWREQSRTFEDIAVYNRFRSMTLTGGEHPERLQAALVSDGLLSILRVEPVLGRGFLPEENQPGGPPAVLLGHGLWQGRFGADPTILDRTLTLDGESYRVVGVLPDGFQFPSAVQLWVPLGRFVDAGLLDRGNHPGLIGIGRLAEGAELEAARAEMAAIAGRLAQAHPDTNASVTASATPLREVLVRGIRPTLLLLLGAVGFLLLIACANVANLLLARGAARGEELAVRVALGAGRGRLVRQLLTESAIIALFGGALGVLIATWGIELLGEVLPLHTPVGLAIVADPGVLAFALAVSLGTSILCGLAPALHASRIDVRGGLQEGGRAVSPARHALRRAFVISEVTLSLVLLIGAGLMARSLIEVLQEDPGFDPGNVLSAGISLSEDRYPDGPQVAGFHRRALARVRSLPGVERAAVAYPLPFGPGGWQAGVLPEGMTLPASGDKPLVDMAAISPEYFRTMRIPLIRGRELTDEDDEAAPDVVVVSESAGRRLWPDQDPLGRRVQFGGWGTDERPWRTVVGVVGDVKHVNLETRGAAEIYVPLAQEPLAVREANLIARTATDPTALVTALRRAVAEVDPELPVYAVATLTQIVERSTAGRRLTITLMGLFAGTALLLALAGIYGVINYVVSRRTHEFGVRMALGARPLDLLVLVVGQGLRLTAAGLVLGIAVSLGLSRLLSGMLFQVSAADPLTYGLLSLLMLGVAALASYAPARRAARIEPIAALRHE